MDFPTKEQVEQADREQLARWYRHLVPTASLDEPAKKNAQRKILQRIGERFRAIGGMDEKLSQKIGY
jgi:hypothetical protein